MMRTHAKRAVVALVPLAILSGCGGRDGEPPSSPAPYTVATVPAQPPQPEAAPKEKAPEAPRAEAPLAAPSPAAPVRHRSAVLGGAARPSRLPPGDYACRTGAEYNYRPCSITRDEKGFTWIDMPASLIAFRGVVYDEGARLVLDARYPEVLHRTWRLRWCRKPLRHEGGRPDDEAGVRSLRVVVLERQR